MMTFVLLAAWTTINIWVAVVFLAMVARGHQRRSDDSDSPDVF